MTTTANLHLDRESRIEPIVDREDNHDYAWLAIDGSAIFLGDIEERMELIDRLIAALREIRAISFSGTIQ